LKRYQAVLILDPDLEDKALKEFQDGFRKLLKKGKAANVEVLEDEVRDLAHAVAKHPRARFWRVGFEAESNLVAQLQEEIRHDERLLRQVYLLNAVAAGAQEASAPETEPQETSEEAPEPASAESDAAQPAAEETAQQETEEETA